MLKKIKKFKISLRPSFVSRNLKKKLRLDSTNETFEKIVDDEIPKTEPLILPAALYDTFSKNNTPEPLKPLWDSAPPKALSVSLIVSTIGSLLEIEKNQIKDDEFKTAVLDVIGWEALEQSTHFVYKLLAEEAKTEGCECMPLFPIEHSRLKESLAVLESHKVEISFDETGGISPFFSGISFCFWIPLSKK